MELCEKIVLAHKGFFNKTCEKIYRENSKDVCAVSTRKDYIGIIELDVRKSKDGVLYCYHGTFIQYYFTLRFPRDFSVLKKKYSVEALAKILDVITEDKIVFLDIKDVSINRADIFDAFADKRFKQVIIGHRSVSFLKRFYRMPREFVKIINGNVFCNFYNIGDLRRDNFRYFEVVFPFQVRSKIIERVKKNNLEFRCAGLFFFSKESYWRKINKYNIKHISSDFI